MQSGPSCQQHGRYCNAFRTTPGVVPRPHAWKRRPRHQTRTESRGRAPSARSLVFQYSLQTVQFQEGSVPPVERGASSSCLPPPSLLETFARASLVRCPGSHNLTCPSPTLAEFSRARLRSTACTLRLESRHQSFPQFIEESNSRDTTPVDRQAEETKRRCSHPQHSSAHVTATAKPRHISTHACPVPSNTAIEAGRGSFDYYQGHRRGLSCRGDTRPSMQSVPGRLMPIQHPPSRSPTRCQRQHAARIPLHDEIKHLCSQAPEK